MVKTSFGEVARIGNQVMLLKHGLLKEVTTIITQILVLKTKIACTIPRSYGGKACNYDPHGNVIGQKPF
ncbi:hypothetical protein SO802_023160 [Lithocarpus litseifolius]|uniref:Uncharacterized protein n=1 Tax=Lithocarpus litseifolius TaxID=425828 RepID=A0AAW2C7B8_9ROSI